MLRIKKSMSIPSINISKRNVFFLLLVLVVWILCCLNYNNIDYHNYVEAYNAYGNNDVYQSYYQMEKGFVILCKIFFSLGFSFFEFRIVFMTVYLIFLVKFIKRFSCDPRGVLILFMIYPFLTVYVQIRNAMAVGIVLYALKYLYEDRKRGNIKFIICVLLATLIHTTAIVYLLFVWANKISRKNILKFSIIFFVMELIIIRGVLPPTMMYLAEVLNNRRFQSYVSIIPLSIAIKHMLPIMGMYMIFIYGFQSRKTWKKNQIQENKKMEFLYKIVMLTLLYVPSIMININFSRLYMYMFPIYYAYLSHIYKKKSKIIVNDKRILRFSGYAISIFFLIMFYGPQNEKLFNWVTKAIFENNLLFSILSN